MRKPLFLTVCASAMALLTGTAAGQSTKIVYFVRHAEDEVAIFQQGKNGNAYVPDCKPFMNEGVLEDCCTEVLSPLGLERAELLAQWFADHDLLPSITHVLATHKVRTLQTVLPTAHAAGLDMDINGDGVPDGEDVDKNPGDGVQQIPAFAAECEDGFEIAHNFYPLVVEHLLELPLGSGIVVAGHSASIYPIMEDLGIDTSDSLAFPKNAAGRVNTYNNLWVVSMDENNQGTLLAHVRLDFALAETITP